MSYTHLLLTRFNVRGSEADALALDEAWLERRFELFDKYCFPSIASQSCKDFKWIILFDGKTPERFRELEKGYQDRASLELHFEYLDGYYDYTNLAPVLTKYINEGVEYIVTSRVDSDDALASDYIAEVRKHLPFTSEKNFISFKRGAQYFSERDLKYDVEYGKNHFTTLIEPATDGFKSVLCFDHTKADSAGVFTIIETGHPMWTEVVHGDNIINNYTPAYRYSTSDKRARRELRRLRLKYMEEWVKSYRLVISNYLFGTSANAINALISLLIFPYVIRVLGIENYGLYAFALIIANTIIQIESVPFNLPFGREAAAASGQREGKSSVFSKVMSAKLLLIAVTSALFFPIILLLPQTEPYRVPLIILFISILGNPFMPNWYYQAIQKTKVIANIQVSIRLLSIPFIFIFITAPEHVVRYAIIYTASTLLCALISFIYLKKAEKLDIFLTPMRTTWESIKKCLPTFLDSVSELLTKHIAGILIGSVFGMVEMAFYDLANKIISILNYGISGINAALMPHVISKGKTDSAHKMIAGEALLGLIIFIGILLAGQPLILLLGGEGMEPAFLPLILLTAALAVDFVSDSIVYLSLVPKGRFKEIPYGRYTSLGVFLLMIPFTGCFTFTYLLFAILLASLARVVVCTKQLVKV